MLAGCLSAFSRLSHLSSQLHREDSRLIRYAESAVVNSGKTVDSAAQALATNIKKSDSNNNNADFASRQRLAFATETFLIHKVQNHLFVVLF
jgi:hypothetical protein